MPPQRTAHARLQERTAPMDPIRPRRNQPSIQSYATLQRREVVIQNPVRVPQNLVPVDVDQVINSTENNSDDLPEASDLEETNEDFEGENNHVDQSCTPMPAESPEFAIPTTVTLRVAQELRVRVNKPRDETTWVKDHYIITHLDACYQKTWVKSEPWYIDRLWSCRYCNKGDSTDTSRRCNTSNLIRHLRRHHNLTKNSVADGKHIPSLKGDTGMMNSFIQNKPLVLHSEEGRELLAWKLSSS